MTTTSIEYRDQFLERITELLADATFDTSVPLADAVDRVMRAAPIDHPYNDDIGPFFTPARAARELDVSRQAPVDGWAIATWLSVPHPALGDLSVRQWVDRGKDTGLVETLARQTAAAWSM